jgi:putative transposase
MVGLVTHLQRLKHSCWHALSSHFARWAKPLTSSLPLSTLADLNRSRSELVAEIALLRRQLLILRRQVKRPSISRTDRMLLVLLARLVRTWQQALLIVQPDTRLGLASGALSPILEAQIKDSYSQAEGRCGNHRLDQADGNGESTMGC